MIFASGKYRIPDSIRSIVLKFLAQQSGGLFSIPDSLPDLEHCRAGLIDHIARLGDFPDQRAAIHGFTHPTAVINPERIALLRQFELPLP